MARTRAQVVSAVAGPGQQVSDEQVSQALKEAFPESARGERVLVLVPDTTRDVPLARLVPMALDALAGARGIQVMVALGTHPPMSPHAARQWLGLAGDDGSGPARRWPPVTVTNHEWANPSALAPIGTISAQRLVELAGPFWHSSLGGDLVVRANRAALSADRVVIIGPTLPHEVAGFSGGAKYLFPGISGPEMIDVMHWLAALAGVLGTIGIAQTPVRALIDQAAALLPTPVDLVALVTGEGGQGGTVLNAVFAGEAKAAWAASVPRAAQLHTKTVPHPYPRVISCPKPIYGELWTAGKAMYKLEPAVADGGELVIYAPHLNVVSATHGRDLFQVGYHVLEYFLGQWDQFSAYPLAVLAHSTHVKGAGTYDVASGAEVPRVTVKLATGIPPEDCARLNLGYEDPEVVAAELASPAQSTLVAEHAGEVLYRPVGHP